MRHRQDIDGLRALAIVPVVLFHAGVKQIPGGFVGVDIFFVISGYLITSLILGEMSEGRFSLLRFYERRVRRIFPALFAVLAFCSVVALLLFLPRELRGYDRSLMAATFFVSNIHFYNAADYFGARPDSLPLLHTWSLSIEEQFYVVFPLLLIVSMYWGRRISIAVIAVLFALSLAASIVVTPIDRAAAFYLAPMRAWELMLGALLAVGVAPRIESHAAREALAFAGIALIAYALFFFDEMMAFPSWTALIPALGAALVIYAGDGRQTLVARGLSLSPFVFIGLISYSLYLWHWPLLVFARYWNIVPLDGWQSAAIVALSLMLAALSWRYVEQPFRRRQELVPPRMLVASAAAAMAVFVTLAVATSSGWQSRFSPQVLATFQGLRSPNTLACRKRSVDNPCVFGAKVEPNYAVWGDSHALMMIPGLDQLGIEQGFAFKVFARFACPPLSGMSFVDTGVTKGCTENNAATLKVLEASNEIHTVLLMARAASHLVGPNGEEGFRNPRSVILSSDGEHPTGKALVELWETHLRQTIQHLLAAGKNVVLVYPTPELNYNVPQAIARTLATKRDINQLYLPFASYQQRERLVFEILDRAGDSPRILRVYPHKSLCDAERCFTSAGGKSLYNDDDHLSIPGAKRVLPEFAPVFANRGAPSMAKASPEITSALPVNRVSAQQ
jgi:peptidoglycan/LPS O-acetylase OafA/YrhL